MKHELSSRRNADSPASERDLELGQPILGRKSRRIPARHGWAANLWVELRPQQWVKNFFVFTPLLFSQNLFNPVPLVQSLTAFALFCFISSSVYLLNDIKDHKEDRLHPQKRHRPLASGELGVPVAWGMMLVLLLCAAAGGVVLNKDFAVILVGYWLINLFYSVWLQHKVILDVFAIASGFVLRVVGGAAAIHVEISHWLLLCTTLLALFLGFSKRRHELGLLGEKAGSHRQVLLEYDQRFLDVMIGIVTASTVMSYALYTVSEETVTRFHTRGLILTFPFVLYGIFRYLYLIYHKDQGGDPTQNLLSDSPMLINLGLWTLTAAVIVYWR